MRSARLLLLFLFLLPLLAEAQQPATDSVVVYEPFSSAEVSAKKVQLNLGDEEEVAQALRRIHTFRFMQEIVLEGRADEEKLSKILYRLSILRNLNKIILRDNELQKIPNSLASCRSVQSLVIENNPDLDIEGLCQTLKEMSLTELVLADNDLKQIPAGLSQLGKLRRFQLSGGNSVDYEALVENLAAIPSLLCLSIPLNYISELPSNIGKLRSLQVLDVSENNFTELPDQISALKNINNLSIQGNLLIDPAKELEKLKGNEIRYLSLDKEISGNDIEKIKRMFPVAEIYFPLSKENLEELVPAKKEVDPDARKRSGELSVKKEARILSGAYAMYPAFFQGVIYTFDTLTFEQRYLDLRYTTVHEMTGNRTWLGSTFSLRTHCVNNEHKGKRRETWFRLPVNDQYIGKNYPELRAFSGMYWIYEGPLSKKQFHKQFLKKRQVITRNYFFLGNRKVKRKRPNVWNDIRIDFDRNNNLFMFTLKSDSGFAGFKAYPVMHGVTREICQETYHRRYSLYKRALIRRGQTFARWQNRNRRLYDISYRQMQEYGWKELQMRMSDEEKLMSRKEWLEYYDNIIANEVEALNNTALSAPYILRSLQLREYQTTGMTARTRNTATVQPNAQNMFRNLNVDFMDATSHTKLAVAAVYVIDNQKKVVAQYTGTLGMFPVSIALRQFSGFSILVELRNGNWGLVSPSEIDGQNLDPDKTCRFDTRIFDRKLDTIGNLLAEALK